MTATLERPTVASAVPYEPLLDVREVADRLRISVDWCRRSSKKPDGLPVLRVGGRRYYRWSAVEAWLEAQS